MNFLFDPNVAYLLLVVGFVLAIMAVFAPGTGLLEIGAIILLVFAGISIAAQPFNMWALLVLILGVFPFVLALRRSHNWIFLAISLVALFVGSIFLVTTPSGQPAVNPLLAIATTLIVGGGVTMVARRLMDALAQPVSRNERVIGQTGEARTDILREGSVYVGGENWSATSRSFIPSGSPVVVKSQDGLIIEVELKS